MMFDGAIVAVSNLVSTILKRFKKTPEEKRQALLNKETERLSANRINAVRYLKDALRRRRRR